MINKEWTREDLQKYADFASMSKEKAKEHFSDLPQFLNGVLYATDFLLSELIDIFDEYEISYTPEGKDDKNK